MNNKQQEHPPEMCGILWCNVCMPDLREDLTRMLELHKDRMTMAWEYGKVLYSRLGISASHDFQTQYMRWAYDVRLERKSKSNMQYGQERGMNTIRLVVNDEGIQRI